jgi:DNA-binding transcriptional LysR family regulator
LAAPLHRTIHIIAEVQAASLQRELVAAGLGVGLIPEWIA